METVKVNVTSENGELVIRTGEAAPNPPKRRNVNITSVDICAPAKYWLRKKELYSSDRSHVLYKYSAEGGHIELVLDEDDDLKRDTVKGVLTKDDELKKAFINSGNKYTYKELYERLRWLRSLFPNQEQYLGIIGSLKNFKANVEHQVEKVKEDDGNTFERIVTTVSQSMPLEFVLRAPIFKGQPADSFTVNIIVTASGNSVVYTLESLDLYDKELEAARQIITTELSKMPELVAIQV